MNRERRRDLSPDEARERFVARREGQNEPSTVRSYNSRLEEFVDWCEDHGIESMQDLDGMWLDDYELYLQESDNAPATVKGKMVALDQLLKYCANIAIVDEDLPDKIQIPRLSKEDQTSDELLEAEEAKRLLGFYRDSRAHYGTEQHVILEVVWHVGARTSCLRALDYDDWKPDERKLTFRHRPPTRLKDGEDHERNVVVSDEVADALGFYIERDRPDKRDEQGRRPLLATNHGRASGSTVQCWAYQATEPCVYMECPHNRRRETCEYTRRTHASKCPSSRAPHAIRTGSITWQLNNGISYVKVANRVAASPETIRRYYDKPDHDQELQRRLPETENLDIETGIL